MDGLKERDNSLLNVTPIANSEYKLVHWDSMSQFIDVAKVEQVKNAKYVGEFSLKTKDGGFSNQPALVFYQKEAHPQGSNYFALFYKFSHKGFPASLMITDTLSSIEDPRVGILNERTGNILYSAYRHDYQFLDEHMIDGGAEYTRSSLNGKLVNFTIVDGEIVLLKNTEDDSDEDIKQIKNN